jgi:hypothetical protein
MPPLPQGASEPTLAPDHWIDAKGTCTGDQPATFFGAVAGYSFRYEVQVRSGERPAAVDLQIDEDTRRSFVRLQGLTEGGGNDTRLVVYRGQTFRGEPRVFAWAGVDRRFHFPGERCQEQGGATEVAPAAAPVAQRPAAALAPPAAVGRFAGGRTVAWWQERLAALRKDGPPELYRLALLRAKAAGLAVTEGAGTSVTLTPAGDP